MYRAILAASLLALGAGAATPALAYPGDEDRGPPSFQGSYPPPYDDDMPAYPPPGYGTYGGPDGSRQGAYPPPRAARPSGPSFMPHASAPDTPGSLEAARRLYTVADTVALRGASLCGTRVRAHTGMRTWSRDSMGPQSPQAAPQEGLDHAVTVFAIAKEGPAARAGLKPGDKIASINGESIPAIAGAMSIYTAKIEAALAQKAPIAIGYTREGVRGIARMSPAPACDYRVVFANSPMVNALTDGTSVTVMRGLVNQLSRDEELALVVGHEIGHNVLGHFARGRALGHQSGPFNPEAQASMRQFEKEADYIGLYFVALAGYDMDSAIRSAQRMAISGPMGDRGTATHPSQAERQAVLQAALREIRAKIAQGQALRPNLGSVAIAPATRSYRGETDRRLPIQ